MTAIITKTDQTAATRHELACACDNPPPCDIGRDDLIRALARMLATLDPYSVWTLRGFQDVVIVDVHGRWVRVVSLATGHDFRVPVSDLER